MTTFSIMKMDKTLTIGRGDKFQSLKTNIPLEVVEVIEPAYSRGKWKVKIRWFDTPTQRIKLQSFPLFQLQEMILNNKIIRISEIPKRTQKFSMTPVKFVL